MIVIIRKTYQSCCGTGIVVDWLSRSVATASKETACSTFHRSGVIVFIEIGTC
jgi:hypothetical protein